MKPVELKELSRRLGAELIGANPDSEVTGFALDNREVRPGDVFLAIRGEHHDGHGFVLDAIGRGAVAAVVEHDVGGPQLKVTNLVDALAQMAASFRSEFQGPVIGITGSAGKTSTKEFLAQILSPMGPILKTPGNRNTEYTAPLLWAEREGNEVAAIVEMSMRGFGQIDHLASFSQPDVAIITNIGPSHLEKVGSLEGVARAKSELLAHVNPNGVAILPFDDPFFQTLVSASPCKIASFGVGTGADCQLTSFEVKSWTESRAQINLNFDKKQQLVDLRLPLAARHFAINVLASILVAQELGLSLDQIKEGAQSLLVPGQRMQVLSYRGATIVFDAYNASPSSFSAALQTLGSVPTSGKTWLIAGEMKELGSESQAAHQKVAEQIFQGRIDHVAFVGDAMLAPFEIFKSQGHPSAVYANDATELINMFEKLGPGDTVLLKGSRAVALENALPQELRDQVMHS